MSGELQAALDGVLIALVAVLASCLAAIGPKLPRLLGALVERITESVEVSRTERRERASDRAVAAVEESARKERLDSAGKLSRASEMAREEYGAPVPLAAIQASVAKLRTSQSSALLAPVQLPLGAALSIPVQVVSSSSAPPEHEPPPIPRPSPTGFRGGA